jgi:hydrogenase maturation protein HypF
MIAGILRDLHRADRPTTSLVPLLARRFHGTLASMIVAVAARVGLERIVLSGGCFQNVLLTELTVQELRAHEFRPYWHQRVPPNDGGISLGQIAAAAAGLTAPPKRS